MSEMYDDDQSEQRVVTIVDPIERIRSSFPDINLQPVTNPGKLNKEEKSTIPLTRVVTRSVPVQNTPKTRSNSTKSSNDFGGRSKITTNFTPRLQICAVENNSISVNPNPQSSLQRPSSNNRRTPEKRLVSVVSTSLHDISVRRPKLQNQRSSGSLQPSSSLERTVFVNPLPSTNQRGRPRQPSRCRFSSFSERSPTSVNNISARVNRPPRPAGFQPRGGITVTTNEGRPRQVDLSIQRTVNLTQFRNTAPNSRRKADTERRNFTAERQVTPQRQLTSVNQYQQPRIVKQNRARLGPTQPGGVTQKTLSPMLPQTKVTTEKPSSQEALHTRSPIHPKIGTDKPLSQEIIRAALPKQTDVSIVKPSSQETCTRLSVQTRVVTEKPSSQETMRISSPAQAKAVTEKSPSQEVTCSTLPKQIEIVTEKPSSQEICTRSPIQTNVEMEKPSSQETQYTSSPSQTKVGTENQTSQEELCTRSPTSVKIEKERASSQEALCSGTSSQSVPSTDAIQAKTVKPKPIAPELSGNITVTHLPENSKSKPIEHKSLPEVSHSRLKPDVDMLQTEFVKKQLPSSDVQIIKSGQISHNPDSSQVRLSRPPTAEILQINKTPPSLSNISKLSQNRISNCSTDSKQVQSVSKGMSLDPNQAIRKSKLHADSKVADMRKDSNSLPSQTTVDTINRFGSNVTLTAVSPNTERKPKSDPRSITPSVSYGPKILLDHSKSKLDSSNLLAIRSNKRPKIKLSLLPKDKSPTTAAPPLETPPIVSNQPMVSSLCLATSSQPVTSVSVCTTHNSQTTAKDNPGNILTDVQDDSTNTLSDKNKISNTVDKNTVSSLQLNKNKEPYVLDEFFVFKDTVPTFEDLENDMNQEPEPILWTPEEPVNQSELEAPVTTISNMQSKTSTVTTDSDSLKQAAVVESSLSTITAVHTTKPSVESFSVQTTASTGPTILNLTNNYSLQAMLRKNAVNSLSSARVPSDPSNDEVKQSETNELICDISPRISTSATMAPVNQSSQTKDNTTKMDVDDDEPIVINKIDQIVLDDSNEDFRKNTTDVDDDYAAECFSISSSDEGKDDVEEITVVHSENDLPLSTLIKEPIISTDNNYYEEEEEDFKDMFEMDENDEEELEDNGSVTIHCRTIRIGSYKFIPPEDINISPFGLKLRVPDMHDTASGTTILLKVPTHHIVKVLAHYGRTMPVLFFYLTPTIARIIRNKLGMHDPKGRYFNPIKGALESQRRFTLVAESIPEDVQYTINLLYKGGDMLNLLTPEEANDILYISTPTECTKDIKPTIRQPIQRKYTPKEVQTIMVFPPPPCKGGISINTEDYACLEEDVFLNDVIIDFYLQYLLQRRLSPDDRGKTHVFSSFFYKRLTNKSPPPLACDISEYGNIEKSLLAAKIRHSRVKNWTKNIDLFKKDYIVIPLNENQHWFLAIICFPSLSGPVRIVDNKPVADKEQSSSTTTSSVKKKIETVSIDMEDEEDKDEAEGDDEELYLETEESPPDNETTANQTTPVSNNKKFREPIKQPCILIFDSLAGVSRSRIIATLRDYLKIEYLVKHGVERDFSKNILKGACPKVPQQNNFTDCGLFVLQYVEEFFKNKIWDYHIPIKILQDWFDPAIVSRKRYQIQQLLLELMREQNIDPDLLNLPALNLSSGEEMSNFIGSPEYDVTPVDSSPDEYESPESDDFYDSPTNMCGSLRSCDDDEAYVPEELDYDDESEFDEESYAELETLSEQPFETDDQDYNADNEPYDPEDDTREYFDSVEHDPLGWQEQDQNDLSPEEREDLDDEEIKVESPEEPARRRESKRAFEMPSVTVTSDSITTDLQGLKQYRMSGIPFNSHSDEQPPNKKYKK